MQPSIIFFNRDKLMIKTFQITIPLSFKESFELVRISGKEITSWGENSSDPANGYIDWKQSFWALTGNTLISAQLKEEKEDLTSVIVSVHKPLQLFDLVGICPMVFNKLLKSLKNNVNSSGKYKNCKIRVV